MQNIIINEGTYKIRGKDVDLTGMVFPLVEEFKVGAKGGYVTVDGKSIQGFPDREHQDHVCQRSMHMKLQARLSQQA